MKFTELSRALANQTNLYFNMLINKNDIKDQDIRLALLQIIDMYNKSSYKDKINTVDQKAETIK